MLAFLHLILCCACSIVTLYFGLGVSEGERDRRDRAREF